MVAVTAPGAPGALRRRLTALRLWGHRRYAATASGLARALRGAATALLALRGLAGLALVAYGAWLAYEPAGFIVGGVLLLADRISDWSSDWSSDASRRDTEGPSA